MTKITTVVFDLYGTLIYLDNKTNPYQRLIEDMGFQTHEEFRHFRYIALTENFENLAEFVARIKPNAKINLNSYEDEIKREASSSKLYSETKKVLNELKKRNLKLGLISNLASPYKKPFFDLELDVYFDKFLFSCDIGSKKPDSKIYQKIVQDFAINPQNALMIGDKIHADVNGPRLIGMNAVHLDRKDNSSDSIASLDEVFKYL